MVQNKWLKLGAASFLSMSVLAACGEEEPVEEEEVIEEDVIEEEPVEEETTEEDGVEEEVLEEEVVAQDELDYGAIDQTELETTYLEPLGWTFAEFEDYTMNEYDMAVADFTDFAELEETVGTVEEIQAAEGEAATEVDFGAIDETELETTYLTPLDWTATEFEEYTMTEYDMAIADFTDFTELEETVGTVEEIEAAQ